MLVVFDKGELELLINRRHDPYLDDFFFYFTYLGDGRTLIPIIIILFFRKIYYGILALLSFLISTLVSQAMKRMFFADFPRPSKFFEKEIDIHVIQGLELHSYYSFPSGHSSGAFAVFLILGMFSRNVFVSIGCFLVALLVAFSRIYLMQHFFIDTYFGAIIGAIIAFLVFYILERKSYLPQNSLINRPLLKIFNK
ncbi:MAG: phosphatase PAP2 family protein [Cytophagaceae bacterium]|nr:phosphatase PAP2 family protein [Cytophagaceae bacterium]